MNKCYFPFTCTSESLRDTGLDGEQSDMRHIPVTVSTEIVSRDTQPSNSLFLSLLKKKKKTEIKLKEKLHIVFKMASALQSCISV